MRYKRLLKNVLAAALIAGLLYAVGWQDLWTAFKDLTWHSIGLLLLISVVLIYLSALKWSFFLQALAFKVSVIKLFGFYLVGYFINLVLPSYIGGDAVRSFYVGKKVGQYEAFTATILERYTGIVAMVTLGVVCMWFSPLVTWQIKAAVFLFALGMVCITVAALSPKVIQFVAKLPKVGKVAQHLDRIQEGFHLARKDHWLLTRALVVSFIYHTFTVINVVVAAWAVGWTGTPYADLFTVLPIILLIGSLPISPSGLGIQEGAFYFFLQGLGASPAQALGVGLLLRAKSYLLAIFGGLVWLVIRRAEVDFD